VFAGRLFYLQIVDDSFTAMSMDNAVKKVYEYPQRGFIYDRDGKLLVSNQPSYDLMAIPREVGVFDTLGLSKMLGITPIQLGKQLDKAKIYSPILPSVIVSKMTKSEYAYLQEKMWKFEGFYIQKRSLRDYNIDCAANVLGYIAEVNQAIINNNAYYQSGDLIGRQGVEQYYEELLRGVKGVRFIQKDRFNRDIGPYKNGTFDTLPQKGKDLTLTLDAELQAYAEKLMKNKRGGVVAIEPATGEILTLATAPSYDPSLLVGRKRSKNFTKLWYDTIAKPLFDRSLLAMYPPGSPFKTLTGLIALQEGVVDPNDVFYCYSGFRYASSPNAFMGCHDHPSPVSLPSAVALSCNSYFSQVYLKTIRKFDSPQEGMNAWEKHLESFGLGDYLGYDLPIGRKGKIPDADYYNRVYQYPKYNWYATATISNAIGQGEILTTPIQLANFTAAIANRGWYYTPHILKKIEGKPIKDEKYTHKNHTSIDPKYFEPVIEGMFDVFNWGTAGHLQVEGIEICGKTGTAENFTEINGKRVQLTDHSIFVAFAPKDNPKIALSVFVENGYWGSRYAGRIASLLIEKYLNGEISEENKDREEWVLSHSLLEEYAKPYSSEPFKINQ
jgi:penicillin-binding protein 2